MCIYIHSVAEYNFLYSCFQLQNSHLKNTQTGCVILGGEMLVAWARVTMGVWREEGKG